MSIESEPHRLEEQAHTLLAEEKLEDAFRLFRKAARGYESMGSHQQAALCCASAGSCWSKRSGEKAFLNAALAYEDAAQHAEQAGDFAYASRLCKFAALNYERDGEFLAFSECYYRSKEYYRRFLTRSLFMPHTVDSQTAQEHLQGARGFLKRILLWCVATFSFLVWGHGERPARTLLCGVFILCVSAVLYMFGFLMQHGVLFRPSFFEAFYFSVVTFTTVGYGDFSPVGLSRLIAVFESFCALFVIPLFIVGFSRKYLRV